MARLSEKIGYGFGDLSSSMFWKVFSYYLPFFYSNVFGLSLADAGWLLLITKLWDAVSDPLMGILADRTKTRWGKYRPYLLWVALPFAVAGVLTFTTPAFGYTGKLVWAYCTYILMMTVYTAINVPYGAMLGVMSADQRERNVFSSYRMFFAYGGSFIAVAMFEPLCRLFGNDAATASQGGLNMPSDPAAWQTAMIVIAAICFGFFLLSFLLTRERVNVDSRDAGIEQESSVGRDIRALLRNAPWWILLGVSICVLLFNSIRGGAAAYYFADYIDGDSFMGSIFGHSLLISCAIFLSVGEIANMLGVVLAVPLARRIGKKNAYIAAILTAGIFTAAFYLLSGEGAASYWLMLLLQAVISVGAGVTLPLVWSMFADVADYSELRNGNSSVGLIFSSSSMAQKFGGAFGGSFVLWLLAAYGYIVPGQESAAAAEIVQSGSAIEGLRSLMSWIPALACLLGALVMSLYPLSDRRMAEIQAELKLKREEDVR